MLRRSDIISRCKRPRSAHRFLIIARSEEFLAVAARVMRHILVDHARSRQYQKRGGHALRVSFDEGLVVASEPDQDFVALDDALTALAVVDSRKSQVVEMRFFGGLTLDETAEALNISRDTVKRDWKMAKLWLLRELRGGKPLDR